MNNDLNHQVSDLGSRFADGVTVVVILIGAALLASLICLAFDRS